MNRVLSGFICVGAGRQLTCRAEATQDQDREILLLGENICVYISYFTFTWDVDEYRLAEVSKIFPTKHFTPDPNLVVDASLKPIQGAMCACQKVDLRSIK